MMILYYILLMPLLLYGLAAMSLTAALLQKTRRRENGAGADSGSLPGVSVIIPFRNEEQNLPALLGSLKEQTYRGMAEVIFVNDGSEDNGVEVIRNQHHVNSRISIKIIDLQDCKKPSDYISLTRKQQALDLGVAESSHPLIAFTDADMVLAPNWLEALANSQGATGADLVFGHTSITRTGRKRRLFTLLESYRLEFLFAFAYAFSRLNLTGSCMGNNLLAVKDAYLKCGGQRGAGYSITEDRALLSLFRKKGFRTAAAEPFGVTAKTGPSQSAKQFFDQSARWARGGLRPGGGLFTAGLLLLVQNLAFLLSILGIAPVMMLSLTGYSPPLHSIFEIMLGVMFSSTDLQSMPGFAPGMLALLSAANFLLTWIFLALAFKKIRSPAPWLLYPVYYVFMMAETVIFAFMLVFKRKIDWKGRRLRGS